MRAFARTLPIVMPLMAIALLAFFGHRIATFYTDWLWYNAVGYSGVFKRLYGARIFLFWVFGGASFFLAYINLVLADRISPPTPVAAGPALVLYPTHSNKPLGRFWRFLLSFRRALDLLFVLGALIFAALAGYTAQNQWDSFLRFTNPVSFGKIDPVFGTDIGWYVFTLPFLRYVQGWLLTILIIITIGIALLYLYQEGLNSASGLPVVLPHIRGHISALLALILLVKAWGYWFDRYDLMYRNIGFPGAGYTDIHVRLPMLYILLPLAILAAVVTSLNIWRRALTPAVLALGLWLVVSALGVLIPATVQRLGAQPNEATRESPYISRALAATRSAYELDTIEVKNFPDSGKNPLAELRRDAGLLLRTRVWDDAPLAAAFTQEQGLRQYYVFPRLEFDRYALNGSLRQVYLATREIDIEHLEGRAQTWPNRYLRFTHGYGMAISAAESVRTGGTPQFLLYDAPPVTSFPELKLKQPRIYFGMGPAMMQYTVVRTRQREFDLPQESASGFQENNYDGKGGIPLTPLAKAAFAVRFTTWSLLLSQEITKESRMILVRNIAERVKRIAPFLLLDNNAYPVIAGGHIFWIVDCYTTSADYPYSAPTFGGDNFAPALRFNYIRGSVKATVDAYNGDIALYATDNNDPILRCYQRAMPGLFLPPSAMPDYLREHRRYPRDLFAVQRRLLMDYHVTDADLFYNRADAWQIARLRAGSNDTSPSVATTPLGDSRDSPSSYALARLPGSAQEEFVLTTTFTPHSRDNLSALFVARCDGSQYGQRILYRFSASGSADGPERIRKKIRADNQVQTYFSAPDKAGIRFQPGVMQILPVGNQLVYFQSMFARTDQGGDVSDRSPGILKAIVAVHQDRVVMDADLPQMVRALLGNETGTGADPTTRPSLSPTRAVLIEEANDAYEQGQNALRAGDFATYGKLNKRLGELLRQLREMR